MKTNNAEATALYQEKCSKFQDAIYNCGELRGLLSVSSQEGYNDYDDRYWSAIFHKIKPDPTLNKETRLGYGFGGAAYSIIFLYDQVTGKTLCIRGDFDPEDKESFINSCRFGQYFEAKNILVAQFYKRLMLYQINPETMKIQKTIDSQQSSEHYDSCLGDHIERVIFEKTNLDYLAFIDDDGHPVLVKFDWENLRIHLDSLPGYMTRFGLIHCLFVKELDKHPIVVLGVAGKQKVDPDMGYSLFVQNGSSEKGMNMYNFKNEFFQSWTPNRFTFSEVNEDGFIQIDIFRDDLLLTKTIVPINLDFQRKKEAELAK